MNSPCCNLLKDQLERICTMDTPQECPDTVILKYGDKMGLPIKDGGNSFYEISYCPFCGAKFEPKTAGSSSGRASILDLRYALMMKGIIEHRDYYPTHPPECLERMFKVLDNIGTEGACPEIAEKIYLEKYRKRK